MAEYINEQCRECFHFQVCAQVMKNELFIREKMLKEENPKCVHFVSSADIEKVRHGKWIKDGDVVVCSECGEEHAWDEYRATYCEDCGARMDGDEN